MISYFVRLWEYSFRHVCRGPKLWLNCQLTRKRNVSIYTILCQYKRWKHCFHYMNVKTANIFLVLHCLPPQKCLWKEPHLFTYTLVCPNSSQYAITFAQSLINVDFFYFWDRPWYSDECALYSLFDSWGFI